MSYVLTIFCSLMLTLNSKLVSLKKGTAPFFLIKKGAVPFLIALPQILIRGVDFAQFA